MNGDQDRLFRKMIDARHDIDLALSLVSSNRRVESGWITELSICHWVADIFCIAFLYGCDNPRWSIGHFLRVRSCSDRVVRLVDNSFPGLGDE